MRIGLIADTHGNLLALEAVLADLATVSVDRIVCLGDLAVLGPDPSGVIARLRAADIPCLMGNTDAWLTGAAPLPVDAPSSPRTVALTHWCRARLSPADRRWLAALPATIELPLPGGGDLLGVHASPRSLDEVIAAATLGTEITAILGARPPRVFVSAHTHVQHLRHHGSTLLINPGSVGLPGIGPGTPDLPVHRHVRWAEYAVLSVTNDYMSVTLNRINLDLPRMIAAGADRDMPHRDWWIGLWDQT